MDDLVQFFSLRLVDFLDDVCHTPLWELLAWATAETLAIVMIVSLDAVLRREAKGGALLGARVDRLCRSLPAAGMEHVLRLRREARKAPAA